MLIILEIVSSKDEISVQIKIETSQKVDFRQFSHKNLFMILQLGIINFKYSARISFKYQNGSRFNFYAYFRASYYKTERFTGEKYIYV